MIEEDNSIDDNETNSNKALLNTNQIPCKAERFMLPLLSSSVFLFIEPFRGDIGYISLITFFCSFIIFCNFPFLVTANNAKPLYYEDLYVDAERLPALPLTKKHKDMHKKTYTRILIFSHSLLVCAIANYWIYKTQEGHSYLEIVGITGGLLKIASAFNHGTGKATLFIIRYLYS